MAMLEFDTMRVELSAAPMGFAGVVSSSSVGNVRHPSRRSSSLPASDHYPPLPVSSRSPSSARHTSHGAEVRASGDGMPVAGSRPVGETAVVVAMLPNKMVMVQTAQGDRVAAHAAKDLRMSLVRLLVGDGVWIERSPLDSGKARILSMERPHPQRSYPPLSHSQVASASRAPLRSSHSEVSPPASQEVGRDPNDSSHSRGTGSQE